MKRKFVKLVLGVAFATAAFIAPSVVAPQSAEAANDCVVSPIQVSQAYNVNCSYAIHYDVLSDGSIKNGSYANPQEWSQQPCCWANVVSYGAKRGVKVNYS